MLNFPSWCLEYITETVTIKDISKYFAIHFQYTVKQSVCLFMSSAKWCPIRWVYKIRALSSLYKVSSS